MTPQEGVHGALMKLLECPHCGQNVWQKADGHVTINVERYSDDKQLCAQSRLRFCNYVHADLWLTQHSISEIAR